MLLGLAHLAVADLVHYDDVRCVVLHGLYQHVCLLVPVRDHHAPGSTHTGMSLQGIAYRTAAAAATATNTVNHSHASVEVVSGLGHYVILSQLQQQLDNSKLLENIQKHTLLWYQHSTNVY